MRACLKFLSVLFLPVLLSACQTEPAPPFVHDRGTKLLGPGEPAAPGVDLPPTALMHPGAPPSSADLINDPQRFKGMSMDEVTALLGRPSFHRHDADAEIWQYYGPASACVLDLFVYPAPEGGTAKVAYAELRSRGTAAATACMAQIMDGRRG